MTEADRVMGKESPLPSHLCQARWLSFCLLLNCTRSQGVLMLSGARGSQSSRKF